MIESFTVAQLSGFGDVRPDLALIAKRLMVATYEDFIEVLYQDLDECLVYLEADPGIRQEDGEDRLTAEIIGMLVSRSYNASHDKKIGGHADIVVEHVKGWLWIGEAKLHGDYAHIEQGFHQLTTRYLPGTPNADQGALIVYVRNKDCSNVFVKWRDRLRGLNLPDYAEEQCPKRLDLAFYSTHKQEGSGRPLRVRHLAVKQFFSPKDKG